MRFLKTKGEKPYDKCIVCDHLGVVCDGPNFLAMSVDRWCEWCRMRKEYLGLTNDQIAEAAEVSKVSVTRIMALHGSADIRLSTMQAVTRVLVAGTWGQYPCPLDAVPTSPDCSSLQSELNNANERYRSARASIDHLKSQVAFNEKQIVEKDQALKTNRRTSILLSTMLAVTLLVIFVSLMVDLNNPDFGYFWVNGVTNHLGSFLVLLCLLFGLGAVLLIAGTRRAKDSKPNEEEAAT